MCLISIVTLSIFLLNIVHIQSHSCSCSCCLGAGCQVAQLPNHVDAQQCTDASCLEACKTRYYQCNVLPTNGHAIGKCLTATTTTTTTNSPIIGGPYSCQCNCCNTGTYLCTPSFVGYTNAYSCQVGTCSIACTKQYSTVCVSNQFGQTQGTCVGLTSSTAGPSGSVRCGCSCYGSSGSHNYEVITTNSCSSCASACRSIQLQCSSHQNTYCVN